MMISLLLFCSQTIIKGRKMYYTNIKDYEQLLTQNEEPSYKTDIVITIILCAIMIALV